MSWPEAENKDTNYYHNNSFAMSDECIYGTIGISANSACGGFVAMISNYIFGTSENPACKLTDVTQARSGDIILFKLIGTVISVAIIISNVVQLNNNPVVYIGRAYSVDEVYWHTGSRPTTILIPAPIRATTMEVYTHYLA